MKRQIIEIDQEKCTGCGQCIPGCPEGALQIIDGKARLVGDLFCDGLGACLGHCPEGAISVNERESEPYDENRVMENIVKQGGNVVEAHLAHLREHGQEDLLVQALQFLEKRGIRMDSKRSVDTRASGCPGSRSMSFASETRDQEAGSAAPVSELTHWPVQLHLMSPTAPHYRGRDVVLAADCTAYALGDFHPRYLKGKSLAIACPKLDEGQEIYLEKLVALIDSAQINTLSVITMEVPCCRGLLMIAKDAQQRAARKIPLKSVVVGIQGTVLREEWV
jgi:ferredoxin